MENKVNRKHKQMKHFVIITGGGTGSRMGTTVPKQFLCLNELPILMHTMYCFADFTDTMIVTLPEQYFDYWQKLQLKHDFHIPHQLVAGGKTRFESVKNAVACLPETGLAAIHDAVRPFVPKTLIQTCFSHAEKQGSAVAAIPVKDTLRKITGQTNQQVDRSDFLFVQTPQVFRCEILKDAYQQTDCPAFTDDASVVEAFGEHELHFVQGDELNLKITTSSDLLLAECIVEVKQKSIV
ncbi:MAG: 2-C-methyl-D-erythritol 4-phosphate cytidylyltransferase [Bacteroidales bacterium]|jgi:2-C-methyl-D-erythritol 4-phosphate cytidylyltransferase|nr:2-C-methyl-D-erythritol 4-phosphate cytidylyltransferase [Bacteroidales bacterium]